MIEKVVDFCLIFHNFQEFWAKNNEKIEIDRFFGALHEKATKLQKTPSKTVKNRFFPNEQKPVFDRHNSSPVPISVPGVAVPVPAIDFFRD